ncbi:type VII secretion protein EssB [Alkalihalophilus marmarensis]|uniref:type VII secretion protein EssB n=1 Tax=Alkalihalophilus marmarensis TaxID=521377 RepID=UPI002DBFBD39|nr:type VII secretion protein EssB [Alkalihalophilus marmarensis]MEC2071042.1 type VII secretion protein EssB [Alkalihalophilus marmarensis]
MEEKRLSYLEKQIEATVSKDKGQHVFHFQRAKVKLSDPLEAGMLTKLDDKIERIVEDTEDEIKIIMNRPKSILNFAMIQRKTTYAKWLLAHNLLKAVKTHSYTRLHLIVCPENIVFDKSFEPIFLHYGVKESLPPYSQEKDNLTLEVKATISELIDPAHTFYDYYHYHTTMTLSPFVKEIFECSTLDELTAYVEETITEIESREKTLISLPKKKWLTHKYSLIAAAALLLPFIAYSIYSFFFVQPKQEAFIESSEAFLMTNYSEVINQLNYYDSDGMPYVVQYQLATSYVEYEPLTEDQRNAVRNTLTLQSDERYFKYWIHIGRGENEEAIDLARSLEDRDLVMLGLLKYREDIKANDRLSGQEKEEELQLIQNEIDEYMREREELEAEEAAEADTVVEEEEEETPASAPAQPEPPSEPEPSADETEEAAEEEDSES